MPGWGWIAFDAQEEVGRSPLVYDDERAVREAFVRDAPARAFQVVIVGPSGALTKSPVVVERGPRRR